MEGGYRCTQHIHKTPTIQPTIHTHPGLSRRAVGSSAADPPTLLLPPQRTSTTRTNDGGAGDADAGTPHGHHRDTHQPQRIIPTPVDAPTTRAAAQQGVGMMGVVRQAALANPVLQRRVVVRVGVKTEVQEGVRVECPVVVEAHNTHDGRYGVLLLLCCCCYVVVLLRCCVVGCVVTAI